MDRKRVLWASGAVAGAALVALVLLQRRHETKRRTPDWKDPQQPVEGTGGQEAIGVPKAPSPAAAWAAVRPMSPRMMAGSVVHRTYAPTLVDDPESLVR